MDVRYINPFLVATRDIFETMIQLPLKLGKPTIKKEPKCFYEVSSIIGMSGLVSGSVVINMSDETALQLASGLLGEDITELDADCTDAIGEVANMIAGNAKSNFSEEGIRISVPTVVIGHHKVNYPSGVPIISIPCDVGNGKMLIDVAIKKT